MVTNDMGKTAEIELKARIANPDECGQKLTALVGEGTPFSKDDAYWSLPAVLRETLTSPVLNLRVRREKKGSVEYTLVTRKHKAKQGPLEVNKEHEFEVSNALEFEELLTLLGFEKRIVKRKEGRVWRCGDITAELCAVSGLVKNDLAKDSSGTSGSAEPHSPEPPRVKNLGWFLELEILSTESGEAAVIAAREQLLALLEKVGLHEKDLESRYYSELLAD